MGRGALPQTQTHANNQQTAIKEKKQAKTCSQPSCPPDDWGGTPQLRNKSKRFGEYSKTGWPPEVRSIPKAFGSLNM